MKCITLHETNVRLKKIRITRYIYRFAVHEAENCANTRRTVKQNQREPTKLDEAIRSNMEYRI